MLAGGRASGGRWQKILKTLAKNETWPKYIWFKISYLEFLFWKKIGISSEHYQAFNVRFSCRKSQSQQKLGHLFYNTVLLKKLAHLTNFNWLDIKNNMFPQHSQKSFWLYKFSSKYVSTWFLRFLDSQELHSWNTLKANVCIFLYIYVRKYMFQRRSKILYGWGWFGGRLNNFLKAAHCLCL